jgi:hypothetical protein
LVGLLDAPLGKVAYVATGVVDTVGLEIRSPNKIYSRILKSFVKGRVSRLELRHVMSYSPLYRRSQFPSSSIAGTSPVERLPLFRGPMNGLELDRPSLSDP